MWPDLPATEIFCPPVDRTQYTYDDDDDLPHVIPRPYLSGHTRRRHTTVGRVSDGQTLNVPTGDGVTTSGGTSWLCGATAVAVAASSVDNRISLVSVGDRLPPPPGMRRADRQTNAHETPRRVPVICVGAIYPSATREKLSTSATLRHGRLLFFKNHRSQ